MKKKLKKKKNLLPFVIMNGHYFFVCISNHSLGLVSFQAERRRKLGLPPEDPSTTVKRSAPVVEEKKV